MRHCDSIAACGASLSIVLFCMGRSVANIQAEIDRIETALSGEDSLIESAGADGVSGKRVNYDIMTRRLDMLYKQLSRANGSSPMLVRGRLNGMGNVY